MICQYCHGTGTIISPFGKASCNYCKGTGLVDLRTKGKIDEDEEKRILDALSRKKSHGDRIRSMNDRQLTLFLKGLIRDLESLYYSLEHVDDDFCAFLRDDERDTIYKWLKQED